MKSHENQSVIICVTIVMAPWHILLGRNFRHFLPGILKLLEPQSVLLVQLVRILLRQCQNNLFLGFIWMNINCVWIKMKNMKK